MEPSVLPGLLSSIASQGLLGIMLVLACFVAWSKDRELKAERLARIEDARNYNQLSLDLQAQVINAVNKLSDILNELKKWRDPSARGFSLGGDPP